MLQNTTSKRLSPKTLTLLVALLAGGGELDSSSQVGQILSLSGRNIMLVIFSTFVHAVKIALEYL